MGAVILWAWDEDNKVFCKVLVDSEGKLKISDADPFTIEQATPQSLKHVPHGYYAVGDQYLPFAVDADGVLQSTATAAAHASTHEDEGSDEISIAGLAGESAELTTHKADPSAHFSNVIGLVFIIDGGGAAITTGEKGHLEVPFACTITGWTILADQPGSIVVDVWKDTYANFPPTVADTIAGSEKPTLSSAQKNQDLTLSTWTTAVSAGNILAFNVDSVSTVERVVIVLRATKT